MITPNATIVSTIGTEVGKENNALSAYQNALAPPTYMRKVKRRDKSIWKRGVHKSWLY